MSFQQLLGDLQALHASRAQQAELVKSLAADGEANDDKIRAAAADAGVALPAGGGKPDGEGDNDDDADAAAAAGADGAGEGDADGDDSLDEEGELAKSFMFDADGNEVEIVDATKMLKSMQVRMAKSEAQAQQALGAAVDLLKAQDQVLSQQAQLLKSMNDRLNAFASQGRGRAATLSVAEKPAATTLAKSQPADGMTGQEFMTKALEAQKAGRITGRDVSIAEGYLTRGLQVPSDLVSRVIS